jgi:hypothetical protein
MKNIAKVLGTLAAMSLLTSCSAIGSFSPSFVEGDECTAENPQIIELEESTLKCVITAGNKLTYVEFANSIKTPVQNFVASDMATCQIKDRLASPDGRFTGGSVGYPAVGEMPSTGKIKVAVVPVDFSDFPETDASFLNEQIETVDDWLMRFSDGNLAYDWQFKNAWVRAPKEAAFYNWAHGTYQPDGSLKFEVENKQSEDQMISQIFEAADKTYDFKGVEYVLFVLPKSIKEVIRHAPDLRDYRVQTSQGSYQLGFSFTAGIHHEMGQPWHQWLHELLHSHGLRGHAPGSEFPYQIMAADNEAGKAITAWDAFILGWLDEERVACFDAATIGSQTVQLTSMDRDLPGIKTAIVKTDKNELVVIESRRKDKFSDGFPENFYGVQAYVVNTDSDGQRYDGATDFATEKKYFAYYLRIDSEDHGKGSPTRNGSPSNLNVVAYKGDSFTHGNLKIDFTDTGDFDTIVISQK